MSSPNGKRPSTSSSTLNDQALFQSITDLSTSYMKCAATPVPCSSAASVKGSIASASAQTVTSSAAASALASASTQTVSSSSAAASALASASVVSSSQSARQSVRSVAAPSRTSTAKCVEPSYLSQVEAAVLRSERPISVNETEEITVLDNKGVWANRTEVVAWKGELPITEYAINEDPNPEIITKRYEQDLVYVQELAVRYLRPPAPPAPGDIIITQEPNFLATPAPPLVIRQQPPRPCTPEPLVVREVPPALPAAVGKKIITISGKRLPPPPRKVIVERLPPVPSKPQAVITERWLPYTPVKRRVIYQAAPPDPSYCKPKNVIVQWEAPNVVVRQEVKFLGVVNANPVEYAKRYGETLRVANDLPEISKSIPVQDGHVLAADFDNSQASYELEGDIEALRLIDLDAEGLGMYKHLLNSLLGESSSKLTESAIAGSGLITEPISLISSGASSGSGSASFIGIPSITSQSSVESSGQAPPHAYISELLSNSATLLTSTRPSKSALKSESSEPIEKHARIVESFNQVFIRESTNTTLSSETQSPSVPSSLGVDELNKVLLALKSNEQ